MLRRTAARKLYSSGFEELVIFIHGLEQYKETRGRWSAGQRTRHTSWHSSVRYWQSTPTWGKQGHKPRKLDKRKKTGFNECC